MNFDNNDFVDPEALSDGSVLCALVELFYQNRNGEYFYSVLSCLRDSQIIIPGFMKVDEADAARFMNGKPGDEIRPRSDVRFTPDIVNDGEKNFLPVFSDPDQLGEYRNNFSTVRLPVFRAMNLAMARDYVSGLILNPFTLPFVVDKEIFDVIRQIPSRLKP